MGGQGGFAAAIHIVYSFSTIVFQCLYVESFFFFGEVERFDQIHHSASGILCCWVFAFPDRGSD